MREIQESIQQIAEAVAAVLKVEVEIADEQLLRVAGTGMTQAGVLRTMAGEDFVYQSSLRTGKPVVIADPGANELCRPCEHFGNCMETGEICCPITLDGKGIGVIGLLAFDRSQRHRLFADVEATLHFLQKMAELIATKVKEHQSFLEQQIAAKKVWLMMNELEKAVITVDSQGRPIQLNQRAKEYLQLLHASEEEGEQRIKSILQAIRNAEREGRQPKRIMIAINGTKIECIYTYRPIEWEDQVAEWVITLDDLHEMVALAKQVGGWEHSDPFAQIMGNSRTLSAAKEMAKRIAASDSTVVLRGESGTGKELFAKAIHQASSRSAGSFVSINCGAIPEALLESELFGYEEGAFTGARKGGKVGKIELAQKGTLFLDEIGDMPVSLQVKLLRVLQEKSVQRIGSVGGETRVDVRIIAATHRNLEDMIERGAFREDLYYRLHVIPIHLPPLRERREDILPLASFYLQKYAAELGKQIGGFSVEAQQCLLGYQWPGNIRELANSIEYAVHMEQTGLISDRSLPAKLSDRQSPSEAPPHVLVDKNEGEDEYNLQKLEKKTILRALAKVKEQKGRKEEAAKLLGISRATLFRKLKEYQVKAPFKLDGGNGDDSDPE